MTMIKNIIIDLMTMGVFCVDDYDGSLDDLQEKLKLKGYETVLICKDKLYLQLVQ